MHENNLLDLMKKVEINPVFTKNMLPSIKTTIVQSVHYAVLQISLKVSLSHN